MIFDSLFDYTGQLKIECKTSIDDTVRRLQRVIDREYGMFPGDANHNLFTSYLNGNVSNDYVVLYRIRPFMGNYLYQPIFIGTFSNASRTAFLVGKFSMRKITKFVFALSSIFFALLEIFVIYAAFRSDASQPMTIVSVLFFPAIFLILIAAHLFLKWLFRSDVKWITDAVTASLE
jgi:hypothetical protein